MSKFNIFDVLKNITSVKDEMNLIGDEFNPFMINRFLSMSPSHISIASFMNRNFHIPSVMQEVFLFHLIPKKYKFFKYVKNEKIDSTAVETISNTYNLSFKKATEVLAFLNRLNNTRNGM